MKQPPISLENSFASRVISGTSRRISSYCWSDFPRFIKNPLADPYTLGVSSGASVGAVLTIFLVFLYLLSVCMRAPIFSMIGAIITMVVVMSFARLVDRSLKMETLILTGVIFSSF